MLQHLQFLHHQLLINELCSAHSFQNRINFSSLMEQSDIATTCWAILIMHIIPISSFSQPEENEMAECGHDVGEQCAAGRPHQSHQLSKVRHLEDKHY